MERLAGGDMGFSAKTEYGLVALLDLAAAHVTGELLQTREIGRSHGIPERYLEQMLTALRKAGFLKSVRGPHGGFQLARAPEQITIASVEACLEGETRSDRQGNRDDPAFLALKGLDQRAEQARTSVLQGVTLAQLLQERERLQQPLPMFYI
jgi:Rrf2 family cysteine metabolism transcriptional repressor